jgi:hypothetical protein
MFVYQRVIMGYLMEYPLVSSNMTIGTSPHGPWRFLAGKIIGCMGESYQMAILNVMGNLMIYK